MEKTDAEIIHVVSSTSATTAIESGGKYHSSPQAIRDNTDLGGLVLSGFAIASSPFFAGRGSVSWIMGNELPDMKHISRAAGQSISWAANVGRAHITQSHAYIG